MKRLPLRRETALLLALTTLAACRLDTLLQTPAGVTLRVSPARLADSALVGTAQRRVMSFTITNAGTGELRWDAALALNSAWLTLDPISGTAPSVVSVFADPASLAIGTYEDTVMVSTSDSASMERIPLRFTVRAAATPSGMRLVFTQQPRTAAAGAAVTPSVRVAAQDDHGDLVGDFTGPVTIAIGVNPGGGSLSGTTTVAALGGVATFADLRIDKAGSGYTLTASAGGFADAGSDRFDVTPGAAARLVFTVQPSDAQAGSIISPPVEVTAYDAYGNRATTFTGVVTVALGRDGSFFGNAVLSGTKAVAAVGGVARFADLRIDQSGSGYTLTTGFGSGPSVAESARFNVSLF